ncbi:MAG TPA: hypothetical protein VKD72_26750, partial [Gemmataceae bacterium]|nr:hypothetical protein [Gemmataceae bacterium]
GLTQSGVTLGTFDYISPEQALEPRDADARSDIYSLGCTFYHMLTGQPPVPEGTAAKKLHCHQNEAPIDPRELNPDIPDEVAAILARMMAKSPRDRYQRPEHLVQHLLRAAQKLDGGSSPRADGVLFVDAPLPTPPARPLLLAAFAVAAVVALVFALQQSAPPDARGQVSVPRPSSGSPSTGKDETQRTTDRGPQETEPPGSKKTDTGEPVSRSRPFVFGGDATLQELRDFIKDSSRNGVLEIVLKKDLVLAEDTEGGIAFSAPLREVTIRSDGPAFGQARPAVWLAYKGGLKEPSRWTALDFANVEKVKLSGIRVVIDARQTLPMTGVRLLGGKEHTIDDCQFIQLSPANYDKQRVCSLLMESTGEGATRAHCIVRDSAFVGGEKEDERPLRLHRIGSGGHDALTRRGPGFLDVQHCVFGPHVACFRLEGNSKRVRDDVAVTNCSAMLGDGSIAFHVATDVRLQVQCSLFSRPVESPVSRPVGGEDLSEAPSDRASEAPADRQKGEAVLIRQQNGAGPPQYHGMDNRYHNLDTFWEDPRGAVTTWKAFEVRLKETDGLDAFSRVLEASPWNEASPLVSLSALQLAAAFRVQSQSRELRQTGFAGRLIGAEKCDGKDYLEKPLEPPERGPELARQKIVDPRGAGKDELNVFRTLLQALEEARSGDVILIRCDGELPIKPATLEKGDVTIRPAKDCSPVLVLDTKDLSASMFRIHDARVRFQNLEFRLAPAKKGFETLAVATILGEGSCNFEECVLTLDNPQDCALSAVVLADPGTVMRKDPKPVMAAPGPSVSLKRCFVRGSGDLVNCRASRPFRLEAQQSLVALSGSVVIVDAGKYDDSSDASPRSEVDFRNVTAVVGGNLLLLRPATQRDQPSEDLKGIVPVNWTPDGCLFASLGGATSARALISIERGNASDATLLQKIPWKAGKNAYSFPEFIDQPPAPTDLKSMRPSPYDRKGWNTFTGEDAKFLDMVKLSDVPENLARARPSQFVLPELKDYGPTLEKLPTPAK